MSRRRATGAGRPWVIKHRGQEGFALVAAMLIMFLILTLGILAMATSLTETRLVTNEGESDLMFFYAEQVADRLINHFYYLTTGPYGALRISPTQVSNTINATKVMNNAGVIEVVDGNVQLNSDLKASAWIDLRDWEGVHDRRLSGDMYIDVLLDLPTADFSRAYRFKVTGRAWWDYAWMSYFWTADTRFTSADSQCYDGTSTNDDYYRKFNCTPTFNTGDVIVGDTYLSYDTSNTRQPLFRGWPRLVGETNWRQVNDFHYGTRSGVTFTNSQNQSYGGRATLHHPTFTKGAINAAQTNAGPSIDQMVTSSSAGWPRANADIVIGPAPANTAYRILFRNDLDTSNPTCNWSGGGCTYEFNSRVASAITRDMNDGVAQDVNDRGVMMVWQIPFDKTDLNDIEAAFYGDTAKRRHDKMIANGGAIWTSGASWLNGTAATCYGTRINTSSSATFLPYDTEDVTPGYDFLYVPSRLATICGGTRTGIIYVYGDAIVSGVVDGNVNIIATGDIYIDHEIEYEESALAMMPEGYSNPNDIDMLMLTAGGRIVIPQSYPMSNVTDNHQIYLDDWSDAEEGVGWFQPTANYDHHDPPITDDDGSEDIQAVLVSFGYFITVGSGAHPSTALTSVGPYTTASLSVGQKAELATFRSGFYAMPRTYESSGARPNPFVANPWTGTPYRDSSDDFVPMANQSGSLRIVGSVYQYYPGRLNYDYYTAGVSGGDYSCSNGQTYTDNPRYNEAFNPPTGGGEPQPLTDGCRLMGFEMVNVTYDPRLRFNHPAFGVDISTTSRTIPYGNGDFRIVSWEMIGADQVGCADHAGNCW